MSELNEEVVLRMCETSVRMVAKLTLTVVQQECLRYWPSHAL